MAPGMPISASFAAIAVSSRSDSEAGVSGSAVATEPQAKTAAEVIAAITAPSLRMLPMCCTPAVGDGHIVAPGRMTDMPITANSVAHIRLTVTDIARSREFYESVFGWPVAVELPDDADDATRERMGFLFGGVIYDIGTALVGLRPVADDRFDSDRVGPRSSVPASGE